MNNKTHALPFTVLALALLSLGGCVTSYQHLSDPRIENDGFDLLCGGLEYEVKYVRVRADLCKNLAPNGGELVHAAIEYHWR